MTDLHPALPGVTAVRQARIDQATSGTTELAAAIAGRSVRILALVLTSAGTTVVRLRDSGTDLMGPFTMSGGSMVTFGIVDAGWGESAVGGNLEVNSSLAVAIGGTVLYTYV